MAESKALTRVIVEGAKPPTKGEIRIWDAEVPGFCVRIYPTGRRVYAVKYRVGTTQRWMTIGAHGQAGPEGEIWTPAAARRAARSVTGAATDGIDRSRERRERRASITVKELVDRYLEDGPSTRPAKRASSWNADRGNLRHHLQPQLGDRRASSVSRSDVQRMISAVIAGETRTQAKKTKPRGVSVVKGGAGIAQRVLAATRAMWSWGIEQGLVKENPARGIKLAQRAPLERFLTLAEAHTLLATIDKLENAGTIDKMHADITRLLFFTGARRSEITALQRDEVDIGRRTIVLPPERTKAGGKSGVRRIALNSAAVEILQSYSCARGFLFPAKRGEGPTTELSKAWNTIRAAANLPDFRIHDLRHSWASFAVADGASLYLVGKALGHANTRTTERYAHLNDDPLQALVERTARPFSPGAEDEGKDGAK